MNVVRNIGKDTELMHCRVCILYETTASLQTVEGRTQGQTSVVTVVNNCKRKSDGE